MERRGRNEKVRNGRSKETGLRDGVPLESKYATIQGGQKMKSLPTDH